MDNGKTMRMIKKTKIVATLGPSSRSREEISSLITAGMDVARINLSHGDRASHTKLINNIKAARRKLNKDIAILLDTRGPEIRIVEMAEPIILVEGRRIMISGAVTECNSTKIGVNYSEIAKEVSPGDSILLDDGKMRLEVETVSKKGIRAKILIGGILTGRKRVSLPGVDIGLPSVSAEDIEDIIFGIGEDVDFIAASFIRKKEDVETIRDIIEEAGGSQDIIAKIENRMGVENIHDILDASDGLMVARGDLGVEVAAEEVPVIQKNLIAVANSLGKPVITATQMLESMITNPSPTRAEATDVTNAVLDGSDAVMLSGETAMGKYPVEAIEFLVKCVEMAESTIDYRTILSMGLRKIRKNTSDAIAYGACAIAADLTTSAILSVTTSGSTAKKVAMYRPQSQVVAATPVENTLRKLQLVRGVIPLYCEPGADMEEQISKGVESSVAAELLEKNDTVVITAGLPLQVAGTTNLLRVYTVL